MQATSCDAQVPSSNALRMSMESRCTKHKSGITQENDPGPVIVKALSNRPEETSDTKLIHQMQNGTNAKLEGKGGGVELGNDTGTAPKPIKNKTRKKSSRPSFCSPSKDIINAYKAQIRASQTDDLARNSLLSRLDQSHLAHRMSINDIQKVIDQNPIDSNEIESLIKVLTIPSREFGKWPLGYEKLYDFVKRTGADKDKLKKMLNSIPFNLRPGDGNTNSSIGESLDPNLNKKGRNTPLSQSLSDFGEQNPGLVTPPKDYNSEKHKRPMNIAPETMPTVASSTSLTASELKEFESFFCERMEAVTRGRFREACRSITLADQKNKVFSSIAEPVLKQ